MKNKKQKKIVKIITVFAVLIATISITTFKANNSYEGLISKDNIITDKIEETEIIPNRKKVEDCCDETINKLDKILDKIEIIETKFETYDNFNETILDEISKIENISTELNTLKNNFNNNNDTMLTLINDAKWEILDKIEQNCEYIKILPESGIIHKINQIYDDIIGGSLTLHIIGPMNC